MEQNIPPTRPTFESLPNEIIISIFGHLSGTDFLNVMRTCRHFRSLLNKHDHLILRAGLRYTTLHERFILCNLGKAKMNWSPFVWLATGQLMNENIDRLLFHLECAGALRDERHIFRACSTDQDPGHARRVLRTILLAIETICMRTDWKARRLYVEKESPDLLHSFASHLRPVIEFIVSNAYLYIDDVDVPMNRNEVDQTFPYYVTAQLVHIMHGITLTWGPVFLLQLLETKPKFATWTDFHRCLCSLRARRETYPAHLRGMHGVWMENEIMERIRLSHDIRWRGKFDEFGIKDLGRIDFTKWIKAVPNDKRWCHLMQKFGWIEPKRRGVRPLP